MIAGRYREKMKFECSGYCRFSPGPGPICYTLTTGRFTILEALIIGWLPTTHYRFTNFASWLCPDCVKKWQQIKQEKIEFHTRQIKENYPIAYTTLGGSYEVTEKSYRAHGIAYESFENLEKLGVTRSEILKEIDPPSPADLEILRSHQ